jgi:hypothetical protein
VRYAIVITILPERTARSNLADGQIFEVALVTQIDRRHEDPEVAITRELSVACELLQLCIGGCPMNLPEAPIAHEGSFVTHFFSVRDQEKSKDFYVRILGGKVIKPENPC